MSNHECNYLKKDFSTIIKEHKGVFKGKDSEIMYFDQAGNQWMVMGCRPPTCAKDYPLDDLLKNSAYKNCPINIKHAKVPVDKQLEARKWFTEHLQGEIYSLSGSRKSNCSDAAFDLAREAKMDGVEKIEALTRRRLLSVPGLGDFLKKYQIGSLDQFLHRDDLLFPDELESLGEYIGTLSRQRVSQILEGMGFVQSMMGSKLA